MDKATGMGKSSAQGGFKLFIGVSVSSVLIAAGLIIVLRLLSNPDDYGVITTALILPTMLSFLKDWGMNFAMIKYLAQYKAEKKVTATRNVMITGALFELVMGGLLTLLCFFMADFLATSVFMLPESKELIEFASLTILADSFLKASQSTFVGLEKMEYHSLTSILNAFLRCLLAPLLVWLGYSLLGVIQGQVIAQITAGVVGLIIFYTKFLSKTKKVATEKTEIISTLKILLKYGLPLSAAVLVTGFLPQFFNTLLTQSLEFSNGMNYTTALGNFQTAVNFAVIITFFTVPISTVLLPAFSKIKGKEENAILRSVFQTSVKYGSLLTIPVSLMVMVLAEPIVFTVVGTDYTQAPFFLTLYGTVYLHAAIGNLSLITFLNGQGNTETTMKLSIINIIIGVAMGFLLIPPFGVIGLIAANSLSGLPSAVAGLWWINKHYNATIDWKSSTKILLASCIASVVTFLLLSQLNTSYWIEMVVGAVTFLVVYLLVAPLIRAVTKRDVHSLREMLSGLGPFSPIFNIPLKIIETLLDVFDFKHKHAES